jgi:hypothetical protein
MDETQTELLCCSSDKLVLLGGGSNAGTKSPLAARVCAVSPLTYPVGLARMLLRWTHLGTLHMSVGRKRS